MTPTEHLVAKLLSDAATLHKAADNLTELARLIRRCQDAPVLLDDMLSVSGAQIDIVRKSLRVRDIEESVLTDVTQKGG